MSLTDLIPGTFESDSGDKRYGVRADLKQYSGILSSIDPRDLADELILANVLERGVEPLDPQRAKAYVAERVGTIYLDRVLGKIASNEGSNGFLYKIKTRNQRTLASSRDHAAIMRPGETSVYILKDSPMPSSSALSNGKALMMDCIAEIDGLYRISRGTTDMTHVAIEIKSGEIKHLHMDSGIDHITDDIIRPLEGMLKERFGEGRSKVAYALTGFASKMYDQRARGNVLKSPIDDMYTKLSKKGIDFYPIAFPFSEESFNEFVSEVTGYAEGIIRGRKFSWHVTDNKILLNVSGKILQLDVSNARVITNKKKRKKNKKKKDKK